MISLEEVLELHSKSIKDYGGSEGIRDVDLLKSALARPFQTFDEQDLYPTIFEKAAALAQSLIVNHPFVDGNKRTGTLCMVGFFILNNYSLTASSEELYNFVINISTGDITFEAMVEWLKNNSTPNT